MNKQKVKYSLKLKSICLLGIIIYSVGFVYFLKSIGLYADGFLGMSQILTYLLDALHITVNSGLMYFLINIPLFAIGLWKLGKHYISKSLQIVAIESFILGVLPMLQVPIFDDILTSCIVGGILEGVGMGLIYSSFSTDGGTGILGALLIKKYPNLTVGKVNICINIVVYGICAYLFSVEIAIYSFLCLIISSTVADYLHKQNRVVSVFIFTEKHHEMCDYIVNTLNRSATEWMGAGAYSNELKHIVYTVVSEYELSKLRKELHNIDEDVFMVVNEAHIGYGKFEKRIK